MCGLCGGCGSQVNKQPCLPNEQINVIQRKPGPEAKPKPKPRSGTKEGGAVLRRTKRAESVCVRVKKKPVHPLIGCSVLDVRHKAVPSGWPLHIEKLRHSNISHVEEEVASAKRGTGARGSWGVGPRGLGEPI